MNWVGIDHMFFQGLQQLVICISNHLLISSIFIDR